MGELYDSRQESMDPQEKDPDWRCDVHWRIVGQNSRNCEVVHVLSAWSADIDHWENLCILSLLIRELTCQIMKLMCIKYCITITSIEIKDEFLFLFYR